MGRGRLGNGSLPVGVAINTQRERYFVMWTALRPVAIVFALISTAGTPAGATPSRSGDGIQQIAPGELPPDTYGAVSDVLAVVGSIPEHYATLGDEAGAGRWLTDEFHRRGWLACPECLHANTVVRVDVGKCISAWVSAVAFLAVWGSKVLKLWHLVAEAGGFAKVVKLINVALGRSSYRQRDAVATLQEVFNEVGQGLGAVALEVLSIDTIIDNCF